MELHNQHTEKTNWTAFIYGCIAGIVPWVGVIIIHRLAGSASLAMGGADFPGLCHPASNSRQRHPTA
jgi:hypothetical protein